MIPGERRAVLVHRARRLAQALGDFRTPRTGEPVEASRVEEVARYVASGARPDEVQGFLRILPGSYLRHMSRSAGPQLQQVARLVAPVARELTDPGELAFVLRWTARLLRTARRGGPPAGGQRGGYRGVGRVPRGGRR